MATAATNQFAITFFSTLVAPNQNENVIFSPISISSAVALVAAGAEGKSLDEIEKGFGWNGERKQLATTVLTETKETVDECNSSCILKSANGIWLAKEFTISKSYESFLRQYGINVSETDFRNNHVKATSLLNEWVSERTKKHISGLFASGQLDEATKAVIVNALYFKGSWLHPFDIAMTHDADFHVSSTKTVSVKMMYHSGEFRYIYDSQNKCDVIQLDYTSSAYNMVVIVPHEIDGLLGVTSSISLAKVSKWIDSLASSYPEKVDVFLPKFKVSQKIDLKKHLMKLGINQVFTDKANLSGITAAEDLYVSSAVHKAFLEVNEEGTEAAAATEIGISLMSLPPQVRADRPFVFMITSRKTGSIIFLGRIFDPSAE